jgi:pseudaminic acid biosynthesis-associated methylase
MSTQEFWQGDFGDDYNKRNTNLVQNNYVMFSKIFYANNDVYPKTILEFGAGTGQNLYALKQIFPFARLKAVEVNKDACNQLKKIHGCEVINDSVSFVGRSDLVLTKGLLIHIYPDELNEIYEIIYKSASKYILICEYFNPTPMEIEYRGEKGKLWKRDFVGELCSLYDDLKIMDYGFVYKKDEYPQDNLNWFLLRKI